ncbi:CBS domain-containing protein [Mangrovicoccus sp. HB161399]|uniref:CBS domain-containing protein n=1 Tax=Mangrovicoccus sp. HB161399 TaxID=2720392 RepID=UPI0015532CCB|nr:CBS domain-containing protein [Mangrovicoccus sp. HB161399]
MTHARPLHAAMLAGLALAALLALAAANQHYKVTDTLGLLSAILLPLAIYGIATGRIAEISGPGGWGAVFRLEAKSPAIARSLQEPTEDEKIFLYGKGSLAQLARFRERLQPGKPVGLSLMLGRGGYLADAIETYLRTFIAFDPALTVLFREKDSGKVVAAADGTRLLALLSVDELRQPFMDMLGSQGDGAGLSELLQVTREFAEHSTTNAEALRLMMDTGLESLPKLDANGEPIGIVRRSDITGRLLLRLADA